MKTHPTSTSRGVENAATDRKPTRRGERGQRRNGPSHRARKEKTRVATLVDESSQATGIGPSRRDKTPFGKHENSVRALRGGTLRLTAPQMR